jgi:hypothetical protein
VENLKTLSGSSPVFALSNHTTFSQTQTGATVPLIYKVSTIKGRDIYDQNGRALH